MRLTAVSYLNTKPFIYGLYQSPLAGQFELSLDIPSVCAQKLLNGEADIALAPVAIIPELPQAYIVSDFCIGATGPVRTVCLYAHRPLSEIKRVLLDFHSRTSVVLTRLLLAHYWKINPELVPATEGYERQIEGDTAGLIIGDRTMGLDGRFPYTYDLGEAWKAWTGKPFVFAAWMSTRPVAPEWVRQLNDALQLGLDHLPQLMKILPSVPGFDLEDYYRHNISYELDEAKWDALHHFLDHLAGPKGYHLHRNTVAPSIEVAP